MSETTNPLPVGLAQDALREAYRSMMSIRLFEARMLKEFEKGNIPGFVHLYDAQEAIAVATCMNLTERDYVGSTHRGHGHSIAKGCDIKLMVQELMGKVTGLCRGKGGSMHVADLNKGMLGANGIVGASTPLAVGAALTAKTKKTGGVAVAFTGDGASNEGVVFESMNLAVVLKLPVIFLYENNGYGEGTSADYAVGSKDIASRAAAFGMPGIKVDGSDFFAMYEVAREAVDRGRRGEGPTSIEACTTRFSGHYVGDPQLYRSKEEVPRLKRDMDCIKKFVQRVTDDGLLGQDEMALIDQEILQLLDEAVTEGLAASFPDPEELFTDVYATY